MLLQRQETKRRRVKGREGGRERKLCLRRDKSSCFVKVHKMARKLKMTKACVAARKRYRAKKGARGGCPGKRGGNVLRNMAALFPRRLPIFSTVRRSTFETKAPAKAKNFGGKALRKRRRAATSTGGFFGRIGNARRRRAKVEARGGRIFHKYPKVSKTESRRLAQQKRSVRAAAVRALRPYRTRLPPLKGRGNKGGVSRHRGLRGRRKTT
jgi:hypothetical protein